jgi:hypothetical protein
MDRRTILYDRTKVPETSWPDGSPVSNWSKAVAALPRINLSSTEEEHVVFDDPAFMTTRAAA